MSGPLVLVGVPTALGGHLGGMEKTPAGLRRLGIVERLRSRPGLSETRIVDAGDVAIEPGFVEDRDPRAKNRARIAAFLPVERDLVAAALGREGPDARPLIVGGDCTAQAGAMAALQATGRRRLAIAWFDAHGDYNTPDTTPSGNVWGMPFAMICGLGDPDLVGACDGPTADPRHAALIGAQVLDETEARLLATTGVAHFGSGMVATAAGIAALGAWGAAVAREVDALYIAVDLDVLDAAGNWAVQMPERDGLSLETAIAAVRTLASAAPIAGFGATAVNLERGGDAERTADAVAALAEAALAV
ncbi:MAG: arginase family protein [Chloroflexota bacterium]